jgi:hypothetical protein
MSRSLLSALALYSLLTGLAPAAEPGYRQAAAKVDVLLSEEVFQTSAGGTVELAPLAGDETFLRRVTLDLVGRPPSPAEITAFALDRSADKRSAQVERLLAQAGFGRNWARYWRDVIFYRRSDERALIAAPGAEDYLTERFNANAPWDAIARSFVTAVGDIREQGRTAIIMAQMADPNDVTAEMSRILLGVQIQCAQCHDHPTDRWKRQQFHELAAFFPRVQLRPKRGDGALSFEIASFDSGRARRAPGMPGRGALEHYMPDLNDPSSQGTLMTPSFFVTGESIELGKSDLERRQSLANWMTSPSNPWFAKAFVNRIWAELVGEGFYEPVDDLGPDRKCSAPATMDYLAEQFIASKYDVKELFRTILATQAYQRESRPRRNPDQLPFTANCPQPLRSDQIYDSLFAALGADAQATAPQRRGAGPYRIGGPRAQFAGVFGYDPSDRRDEISGSIPQALLLMNSPQVNRGINARNRNSELDRLVTQVSDDDEVAEELYLRCLAREPNEKELAVCRDYVRGAGDRAAAFEDIFWALINSAEFLHRN